MEDVLEAPYSQVPDEPLVTVACLCAQWCVVCREWEPVFDQLAAAHPQHRWVWVDIEDHEGLEVENFPSLVILHKAHGLCFWGEVTPRADAWLRLLQAAQLGQLKPTDVEETAWMTFGQESHTLGQLLRGQTP
jgi:thioredoxin 1